jgi:hypothetical protein
MQGVFSGTTLYGIGEGMIRRPTVEVSCGPPATTPRHTQNDTTVASRVPP